MESPQSVVSPFKNLSVAAEPQKQNSGVFVWNSGCLSKGIDVHREEADTCNLEEDCMGALEVHVHQARDIHNICIYHKQDVYAKLCLTSDPHNTVSTKTINGGGKNPVFNESLRLKVRSIECSLKCEIWMLSRVKNYLEDQLLGFALAPLSEVLIMNGKLEKEYSLSSTDLFHSPAGFVQLSLSYSGASPEVMTIPKLPTATVDGGNVIQESDVTESKTTELDRIEFPDPNILNENQKMVSEYFGIPCSGLDSQTSETLVSSDIENHVGCQVGAQAVDSFSANTVESMLLPRHDSPLSSVSASGPPVKLPAISQSHETAVASESSIDLDHVSHLKEKEADTADDESDSSNASPSTHRGKPIVSVNVEQDVKVVQQDIVDIYMKSMQQFTESLAKMKLPMDLQAEPTKSGDSDSSSDQTKQQTPKSANSRVFYGSRAFF